MLRLCESPSTSLSIRSNKSLSGLFAECDTLNQNERIYPRKIYMPALESILPKIKEGRLLGELDHPSDYDEVRLSKVSHVIKECRVEGNKVYGTVELLDTPAGKIAQALVEAGIPLGISSRGVGNTRRVNEGDEVTDFNLITYDLVADPSFSNAILSESAKVTLKSRLDDIATTLPLNESVGDSNAIRSKIDEIKSGLDNAPSVTANLVESIGSLTGEKQSLQDRLVESNNRNKSLMENMRRLQDSYNLLAESVESIQKDYQEKANKISENFDKVKKDYQGKLDKLTESYNKVKDEYLKNVSKLDEEIVTLRKSLAIEKRGLSADSVMPILEGLTTVEDIENKLDSIKHLGTRRYAPTPKDVTTLTEERDTSKSKNKLSRIVSSV